MARTRPIVRGERIERQLGDAEPSGRANNATHSCYAGAVSLGTWESTHGSPAAVTVKQNSDVEAGTINQFRSRLRSHQGHRLCSSATFAPTIRISARVSPELKLPCDSSISPEPGAQKA